MKYHLPIMCPRKKKQATNLFASVLIKCLKDEPCKTMEFEMRLTQTIFLY